mmetsp:Transcript_23364/g.41516  ORF Transcript_23364/g.41516 Transcript_23364/m.41516 type:complete len:285 (-) Transcript_23364:40-894(-)
MIRRRRRRRAIRPRRTSNTNTITNAITNTITVVITRPALGQASLLQIYPGVETGSQCIRTGWHGQCLEDFEDFPRHFVFSFFSFFSSFFSSFFAISFSFSSSALLLLRACHDQTGSRGLVPEARGPNTWRQVLIERHENLLHLGSSGQFEFAADVDSPWSDQRVTKAVDVVGGEEEQSSLLRRNAVNGVQESTERQTTDHRRPRVHGGCGREVIISHRSCGISHSNGVVRHRSINCVECGRRAWRSRSAIVATAHLLTSSIARTARCRSGFSLHSRPSSFLSFR